MNYVLDYGYRCYYQSASYIPRVDKQTSHKETFPGKAFDLLSELNENVPHGRKQVILI